MRIEIYVGLSAVLIGLGIGSALSRRNIVSIVMAVVTAGSGTLIAMATIGRGSESQNDGMLFALVLGAVSLVQTILGCALAYRRFVATGVTNVGDGNELRH